MRLTLLRITGYGLTYSVYWVNPMKHHIRPDYVRDRGGKMTAMIESRSGVLEVSLEPSKGAGHSEIRQICSDARILDTLSGLGEMAEATPCLTAGVRLPPVSELAEAWEF
jgi:hypothetical protein